jgi:hypothetical protein
VAELFTATVPKRLFSSESKSVVCVRRAGNEKRTAMSTSRRDALPGLKHSLYKTLGGKTIKSIYAVYTAGPPHRENLMDEGMGWDFDDFWIVRDPGVLRIDSQSRLPETDH